MNPENRFFDAEGLEDEPERVMSAAGDTPVDMPPTDPPVLPRGRDEAEIAGAIDELDAEYYADSAPMSDDEITARVRRALRMDASTSMLRIYVTTEDGVVTLQGRVQTLEDTDNAAEVASRIPGVLDVADELEVED